MRKFSGSSDPEPRPSGASRFTVMCAFATPYGVVSGMVNASPSGCAASACAAPTCIAVIAVSAPASAGAIACGVAGSATSARIVCFRSTPTAAARSAATAAASGGEGSGGAFGAPSGAGGVAARLAASSVASFGSGPSTTWSTYAAICAASAGERGSTRPTNASSVRSVATFGSSLARGSARSSAASAAGNRSGRCSASVADATLLGVTGSRNARSSATGSAYALSAAGRAGASGCAAGGAAAGALGDAAFGAIGTGAVKPRKPSTTKRCATAARVAASRPRSKPGSRGVAKTGRCAAGGAPPGCAARGDAVDDTDGADGAAATDARETTELNVAPSAGRTAGRATGTGSTATGSARCAAADDLQQDPIAVETGDLHLQHVTRPDRRRERGGDAPAGDLEQIGQPVRGQHARGHDGALDEQRAQRLRVGRELRDLGVDQRGQVGLRRGDDRIDAHLRP